MVGDGGKPNVYFVTHKGHVTTVTVNFEAAYQAWKDVISMTEESALEDRRTGVLASVEPESDRPGSRLRLHNISRSDYEKLSR
jgi:hypothetical protein